MKVILAAASCVFFIGCTNAPSLKEECESVGGKFTARQTVTYYRVGGPSPTGINYKDRCLYDTDNGTLSARWGG